MKVKLAKTAGFCMGVRRALELTLSEANKNDPTPLYTFGPLIHNNQVLELLASKGVRVLRSPEDLASLGEESGAPGQGARIIIRAHGIPPQTRAKLKQGRFEILDATCPKVAQVQALIKYHTSKGRKAVIVGDQDHPEVVGLVGYSKTEALVIQHAEALASLDPDTPLVVVAQTTQDAVAFARITKAVRERFSDVLIFDTICGATVERQSEVRELCSQVDALVVVGGKESGNTKRLVQIARDSGIPAFHVETGRQLDKAALSSFKVVGVTAGASTPSWLIKDVVREIESIVSTRDNPAKVLASRIFKFLVLSNLAAGGAAFFFSFSAIQVASIPWTPAHSLVAALYLFSMHVLNRFLDKGASAYSEPERATFLRLHRAWLVLLALGANILSLWLAHGLGTWPLLALLTLTLLGLLYSVPLLPRSWSKGRSFSKLKDIPGSKATGEALAWVAVMIVVPILGAWAPSGLWAPKIGGWTLAGASSVFILSFIRSALFELFQVQGDLIVGRETLPIALGERRTMRLLKILLGALLVLLLVFWAAGLSGSALLSLLLPTAGLAACLWAYQRSRIGPGIFLEGLVEANFVLAGLIALGAWISKWPW